MLMLVPGLLLTAGCSRQAWHEDLLVEGVELGEVQTASGFGEAILFGSQPTENDFELLKARGIRTVLNLRTEAEMAGLDFDEESAVHKAGMHYLNIPVGREEPSNETIGLITSIIDDPTRRPLFVHCASSNRVGYVWAVYRGRKTGLGIDEAVEEGKQAGMRSPVLEQWVRDELGEEVAEDSGEAP